MCNLMTAALSCVVVLIGLSTSPLTASQDVPFKARLSVTSEFEFVSATEVNESSSGLGQATHLGRFDAVLRHTVNLVTTEVLDGELVFTAANGDTIVGSYSGQGTMVTPTLIQFDGTFTITDGTGRFENATGGGAMTGLIDTSQFPVSALASLTLDGVISSRGVGDRP